MAEFLVVVSDDRYGGRYDEERAVLEPCGAEVVVTNGATPAEVAKNCADADGIMANLAPFPRETIERLKKCKIISRYGVGYDNVDVKACTEKGIILANVPDYCAEDVSDQALALLMGCVRKIARRDAQVRAGMWNIGRSDPIYRTCGKVFTFLGFGLIGRALLRKSRGLNFSRILVYDPYLSEDTIKGYGCEKTEWEEALALADYISVHMPLNKETTGIVGYDAFKLMKPNAMIINTSRGPIIDEDALVDALKTGKINSAGLDVHKIEPLPMDSKLRELPNCILSDHVSWYSEESFVELKTKVAQNIRDVLTGGAPKYVVNKDLLK